MMAAISHIAGAGIGHLPVLRGILEKLADRTSRPWHCHELHNPWSRVSCDVDAWSILDVCMALGRLGPVAELIGQDIILFDTALMPDPWDDAVQSQMLFPVDPPAGISIICSIDQPAAIAFAEHPTLTLTPGDIALVPAADDWQVDGSAPLFVARFFPATSHYVRDPGHPVQRALMERLPLFNFATMPLWLVAGEDRAGNDFVTGFAPRPPYWSAPPDLFAL